MIKVGVVSIFIIICMCSILIFKPVAGENYQKDNEEIHIIEAEDMIQDKERIFYGDMSGAFKAPYPYRSESGCWALCINRGVQDKIFYEINCKGENPYYAFIRVGVRDSDSIFKIKIGEMLFDINEKKGISGELYRWVSISQPLILKGRVPVELIFTGEKAVVDCIVIRTKREFPPNDCTPLGFPFYRVPEGVFIAFYPAYNFKMPLYVCANTAQHFLLAHSNMGNSTVKNWTLKMDVPQWITLMNPSVSLRRKEGQSGTLAEPSHFSRPFAAPTRMEETASVSPNRKQYILHYEGGEIPPGVNALREHHMSKYMYMITFKIAPGTSETDEIILEATDESGNKNIVRQKIIRLPEPNPTFLPQPSLAILHASYLVNMSEEEQKELISSMSKFGANAVLLGTIHSQEDKERIIKLARIASQNNIKPVIEMFSRCIPYSRYDKGQTTAEYLKKYPQHQSVVSTKNCPAFLSSSSVIEPEHLAEDESEYLISIIDFWLDIAREINTNLFFIDFEESNPLWFSFSKRSLAAFRNFANIPVEVELNESIILDKYKDKWLQFRCEQNAKIIENICRITKKKMPDAKVILYSGYQKETTVLNYGIDWSRIKSNLDYALGGDGIATPQHAIWIYNTYQALKKTCMSDRFMFTEHSIDDWAGSERFSPPETYGARSALAIGCGATGLYSWWWGTMDGLTLSGFNKAAHILKKLVPVISNSNREILDLLNCGYYNAAIITRENQKFVVIANVFSNKRTFPLNGITKKLGKEFIYQTFLPVESSLNSTVPESITLDGGEFTIWEITKEGTMENVSEKKDKHILLSGTPGEKDTTTSLWTVLEKEASRIDSNRYYIDTGGTKRVIAAVAGDNNWKDYTFECDVTIEKFLTGTNWDSADLLVRYVDSKNYYYISVRKDGHIVLSRYVNGKAETWLAKAKTSIRIGEPYKITVEVKENLITIFLNGEKQIEYKDETNKLTSGKIGLGAENAIVYFENVHVYSE